MQPGAGFGKAAVDDTADDRRRFQHVGRGRHRDPRRASRRKVIHSGGYCGESHRLQVVRLAQLDNADIARGQRLILTRLPTMPNRPNGMDHMTRRQAITGGDLGAAGLTAPEPAAFGQKRRPGRPMDRAIDTTTTEQRRICRVDDGVNVQRRDIGDDDF